MVILPALASCDKIAQYDKAAHDSEEIKQKVNSLESEVKALNDRLTAIEGGKNKAAAQQTTTAKEPPNEQQVKAISEVVAQCVTIVHGTTPASAPGMAEMDKTFYRRFDAYYNIGTGLVQDNVTVNGDLPPRYAFRKCMAENGFPLGGN